MLFEQTAVFDPAGPVRRDQYVYVKDRRIAYVGPDDPRRMEAFRHDAFDEVVAGRDCLMLPGFVNDHCHVPMTLLRGYGEGLSLMDWLTTRIFPFEAHLDEEDMYWGALLGIAEMVQSGVVSFTDMYMRIEGVFRALDETGMKANLCNALTGGPDDRLEKTSTYRETEAVRALAPATEGRIIVDAGLHAEYTSVPSLVRELVAYAKDRGLRMQVHLSETETEHEGCKARHGGMTPTAYLADCGLFDLSVTAAHGVYVEEDDLALLAERGATLCHCPSSNLKLGSGIAKLDRWRAHGVRTTIGTDGASSNNNLNMLEEITLASFLQKGQTRDPLFLTPSELLTLASVNGYRSQGREGGMIEAGQPADLVMVSLTAPHLQPIYDERNVVFGTAQTSDIVLTMVDGRVLYRDGEWPTIDIERVLREVRRIRDKTLRSLAEET